MDIVHHLEYVARTEDIQAEQEALRVVAEKADGGMRDALSIFDQLVAFCGSTVTYSQTIEVLNVLDTDYYFRLTDYALTNKVSEALLLFNEILQKGFDAGHFIMGIMQHLRNVLVAKDPQTVALLETSESAQQQYIDLAHRCDSQWLFRALDLLNALDINFRTAKNKRLTVELALVKWCQPVQTIQPVQTVQPAKPAQPVQQAHPVQPTTLPSLHRSTRQTVADNRPSQSEEGQRNTPFTSDLLNQAWAGLVKHFPNEGRLMVMLNDYKPVLTQDNAIVLTLTNPWQQEEINKHSKQIIALLRDALHNDHITMQVNVEEYHKEQQAYTSQEKYKLLISQNPALQQIKDALNLQLE